MPSEKVFLKNQEYLWRFCVQWVHYFYFTGLVCILLFKRINLIWCSWSKRLMLIVSKEGILLPVWMFLQIFKPEHCLNYVHQIIPDSVTQTDYKYIYLESEAHGAEMLKDLLLIKQDFREGDSLTRTYFSHMDTSNVLKIFRSKAIHDVWILWKETTPADLQTPLRRGWLFSQG